MSAFILSVGLALLFGFGAGRISGRATERFRAIENGVGDYEFDEATGDAHFVYRVRR